MRIAIYFLSSLFLFVYPPGAAASPDYLHYYKAVAAAESLAVRGQHAAAVHQYDSIFAAFPYNNPADCYVAAQVASAISDPHHCRLFLAKGISSGLPLPCIRESPHLRAYVQGDGPDALPPALIDSCRKVYLQRIDPDARARILSAIGRDQAVVRGLKKRESIYDKTGYQLKEAYRPFWDSLLAEVVDITRTSGFPAQKVAGTQDGDDGLFPASPHCRYAYYIMVHHGRAWPVIGPLLRNELQLGNITPQMYAAIADYSNEDSLALDETPYMSLRSCEANASPKTCGRYLDTHREQIDSARAAVGLCSYTVMQQKEVSSMQYGQWVREKARPNTPVFDFPSLGRFND